MDRETQDILAIQKQLQEVVGTDGWRIVRAKLTQKILDLQNAFNIDDADPQRMLIDLQARKMASNTLFDFLREIEGTASQVQETIVPLDKSYIVKV